MPVSRPSQLTRIAFFVVVALGVSFWWLSGRGGVAVGPPPPIGPAVPDFALTRQDGVTVGLDDLKGSVCVMDFIFTRCAGPCPELTARMRSLMLAMKDWPEPARLVSITLDPRFDRPQVLRHYAQRFHVDTERWWFLTGADENGVHRLVREGFLQTVIPATDDAPLIHSNHFIILDRAGRIRASHDGMDPESKPRILRDVRSLLAESPAR